MSGAIRTHGRGRDGSMHSHLLWSAATLCRVAPRNRRVICLMGRDSTGSTHSLPIREPDHSTSARWRSARRRSAQEQGDLAGARPLHERALAISEKVLGPEHPDTATSLHNLASLLQDQDDLAGARPLFERALAIYEKVLGPGILIQRRASAPSHRCFKTRATSR